MKGLFLDLRTKFKAEQNDTAILLCGDQEVRRLFRAPVLPGNDCGTAGYLRPVFVGLVYRIPDGAIGTAGSLPASLRKKCIDAFKDISAELFSGCSNGFSDCFCSKPVGCKYIGIPVNKKNRCILIIEAFLNGSFTGVGP